MATHVAVGGASGDKLLSCARLMTFMTKGMRGRPLDGPA